MNEPQEIRLGDYSVRIEGDVFFVRAVGAVTTDIAQGVVQLLGQVIERHDRLFIIGDLGEAGTVPAEARRIFVDFGRSHTALAIAFYRVSVIARGVNALLFAAVNLLGKARHNMRQFSTEQEARAWIAAERSRLLNPGK